MGALSRRYPGCRRGCRPFGVREPRRRQSVLAHVRPGGRGGRRRVPHVARRGDERENRPRPRRRQRRRRWRRIPRIFVLFVVDLDEPLALDRRRASRVRGGGDASAGAHWSDTVRRVRRAYIFAGGRLFRRRWTVRVVGSAPAAGLARRRVVGDGIVRRRNVRVGKNVGRERERRRRGSRVRREGTRDDHGTVGGAPFAARLEAERAAATRRGDTLHLDVDPGAVHLFDPETEQTLSR